VVGKKKSTTKAAAVATRAIASKIIFSFQLKVSRPPLKLVSYFVAPLFIYIVVNKSAELQHQILNEGTCACDLSRVVDFRCMYLWFFHLFDYLDFFFSK